MLRHERPGPHGAAQSSAHGSRRTRSGLTLLELMIALSLGGMILAGAHAVLATLTGEADAIASRAAAADAGANGERMLRALVGRIEVGTPEAIPFTGAPDRVRFTSWCEVPAGWLERCTVTLTIAMAAGERSLLANVNAQPAVTLLSDSALVAFRYLNSAANGGQWFREWGAGISAPLALGVITRSGQRRDTLIVRIGERG